MTVRATGRVAAPLVFALALLAREAHAEGPTPGTAAVSAPAGEAPLPAARPVDSAGLVAKRVVAETMMGLGMATVGYLAAPGVGGLGCADCISAASLAGANLAFPLGVFWGGRMVRGDGVFFYTVAPPWVVSVTTAVALARDQSADGKPAIQIATWGSVIAAPLSILAFELSHAAKRASPGSARAGMRVAVLPSPGGVRVAVGWEQ